MYINKIDDLIDRILDDFNQTVILSDARISKILKENNFVKYQSDINDILKNYIKNINLKDLKDICSNNEIINKIIEVTKKYVTLYIFLFIGFYYKGTDKLYANNIVEFTKNQPEFGFKIAEFFNSESNALITDFYNDVKKIQSLIDAENKQKREILSKRADYKNIVSFLNNLGNEFIMSAFMIEDKNFVKAHNIIKTIIIVKLYKNIEKVELFRMLEMLESTENEFTFIDIVVPVKEIIDIATIESLLTKKQVLSGMAQTIWDYVYESETENIEGKISDLTHDEKIINLINTRLLIPIIDDLLLYHNDNEFYDKSSTLDTDKKKKEDTKIRYIINKIDTATNINIPEQHNEAKKVFYQPLSNRKAVLINNSEDIKIINKFINMGKISVENMEYLKDLEHLMIYPYINLKESENGLIIQGTKTLDTLRYVNFQNSTEFKQRPSSYIDVRVGSKDMYLNMLGFMIRTDNSPYCIKNKDLININTNSKIKNGYKNTLDVFSDMMDKKVKKLPNIYWLFDPDLDKPDTELYEQQNKFTRSEQIRNILSAFYDSLETKTYEYIIKKITENKNKELNNIENIVDYYTKTYIKLYTKKLLIDLEQKIFIDLIKRGKIQYDTLDDMVYGLSKDSIILPNSTDKKHVPKIQHIKIDLSQLTELGEYEEKENVIGVCQHNITWDRLADLKRMNPKLFLDKLYEFIQQYVIENADGNYVCKSCGFYLNIKKYVADGSFDDNHHFISYSMPLDTPLEDIPEYEKFKGTIRSIDKYIEKIGLIAGIPYFVGTNSTVKSRRKLIVRDAIDIILANNMKLGKILKERNENADKLYGINRDYSNLFVFPLENSIFVFSSKDKDFYKPIKQNNILSYIIILIILEINDTQLSFFNKDKKGFCNFQLFDKVYQTIFHELKFRKNNKGDTINVVDYEIFCYMLYIISCFCVKYNLWYYDYKENTNDKAARQKLMPTVQKIIIHTVIDMINSIIENSETDKKNKIFEILKTKFYKKLSGLFSNKDIYNRFREENKPSTIGDKKSFILTSAEAYSLNGDYNTNFNEKPDWRKVRPYRMYLEIKSRNIEKYDNINNITNCETGEFHEFIYDDKTLKCKKCNKKTNELKLDQKLTEQILKKFHHVELKNLSKKYCFIDGLLHEFILDKNKRVCAKCKKEENYNFTDEELNKLDKVIVENKKTTYIEDNKIQIEHKEENERHIKYIESLKNKIKTEYEENITKDNQYNYIDKLITNIESNVTDDMAKNIILMRNDLYMFNHDHLGNKLDKDIVISEKDNKIQYKQNHPFFNTDVIYYTSYKTGKIEVFYDAITKILLGYKEENKNYVSNMLPDKKIKIIYSLFNKFKMFGHKLKYYTINNIKSDNIANNKSSSQTNTHTSSQTNTTDSIDKEENEKYKNEQIANIIRDRINLLKQFIYRFQRIINRLINNYYIKPKKDAFDKINEENNYFNNKFENLIEKYSKKLSTINLVNKNGSHLIMRHWKNFCDNITSRYDNNMNIDTHIITFDKINKYDTIGNNILFYFINELNKLYEYNNNKSIRMYLSSLILDFVNINYNIYNEEKIQIDKDLRRFYYVINSALYLNEIKDKVGETEGIYEEATDPDKKEVSPEDQDKMDDDKEEQEALDVEGDEHDYEAYYERNLERGFDEGFIENYEYNFMDYINNQF